MTEEYPKISVCIPSIGRYELLKDTIESFLVHNTYPNIEVLVYESEDNDALHRTFRAPPSTFQFKENKEYLQQLQHENKIKVFFNPWAHMVNTYRFLVSQAADYFIFIEDDIATFVDPKDHFIDSIKVIENDPEVIGVECSTSLAVAYIQDKGTPGIRNSRLTVPIIKPQLPPYTYIVTGKAGIMPVLKLWKTEEIKKIGFGTKIMHSAERTFRCDMGSSGKRIAVLLNFWGWCGHVGTTSVEAKFSVKHLQDVRDIYLKFATKGMVGVRDFNMPWGTPAENQARVGWNE